MNARLVAAVLVAVALAAALSGCGACTLVGCASSVTVHFPPVGGVGTYVFRIEEEERTWSCTLTIPLPEPGAYPTNCDLQPMGPAVSDPEQFTFTSLWLDAHPSRARLVIERDGTVLLDHTLEPVYQTSQPNGPECPPTCSAAVVDLDS
jgi:hypothetical protein